MQTDKFTAIVKENMALDPEWNKLARLSATPFTGESSVEGSEHNPESHHDHVHPDAVVTVMDDNISVHINPEAVDLENLPDKLRSCAEMLDSMNDGEQ